MCDDISTIFVDGEQKNVPETEAWNKMATLKISNTTKTIGVQCHNTIGQYGVMAQVTEESGEVFAVTDESWQCSNIPEDGWSTIEFNGTWTDAQITFNQQDFLCTRWGDWAFNSPDRKIIWTNSSADTTVYCRKDLPSESCHCLRKGGLSTFVKFLLLASMIASMFELKSFKKVLGLSRGSPLLRRQNPQPVRAATTILQPF